MQVTSNTGLMQGKFRPDTYSTYVRHEMFDIDCEAEEMKVDVDDIDIDYEAYKKALGEWLYSWFIETLNDALPKWLQFVETEVTMYSPKYYNFETDSINVLLEVDKDKLWAYVEENKEGLDKYLKKYDSCDGFISFTPTSYHELKNEEDFERVVMCVLDYLLDGFEDSPQYYFENGIVYDNLIYPKTETETETA